MLGVTRTEIEGGGVGVGGLSEAVLLSFVKVRRQLEGLEAAGLKVRNVVMALRLENTW